MVLDSDLYYEHIHRLKIFGLSVAKMYLGNMHWKVPNVICHTEFDPKGLSNFTHSFENHQHFILTMVKRTINHVSSQIYKYDINYPTCGYGHNSLFNFSTHNFTNSFDSNQVHLT